jgi:hypothetical protein
LAAETSIFAAFCQPKTNEWVLDSGATDHMTSDRSFFVDYKPITLTVRVGNNAVIEAVGMGNVAIASSVGHGIVTLKDVLHVPKIDRSLLSVRQITAVRRFCVDSHDHFDGSSRQRRLSSRTTTIRASLSERLREPPHFAATAEADSSSLWHCRLCHLNWRTCAGWQQVMRLRVFPIQLFPKYDFCNSCPVGKARRQPFPSSASRATEVGVLIHTDLAGLADFVLWRIT